MGVFAGIAVMLAMIGIYGAVSDQAGQRTRELGIRVALGATQHEILRDPARAEALRGRNRSGVDRDARAHAADPVAALPGQPARSVDAGADPVAARRGCVPGLLRTGTASYQGRSDHRPASRVTTKTSVGQDGIRLHVTACRNTIFSVTCWPVASMPVVVRIICCPSPETTHRSF